MNWLIIIGIILIPLTLGTLSYNDVVNEAYKSALNTEWAKKDLKNREKLLSIALKMEGFGKKNPKAMFCISTVLAWIIFLCGVFA